MVRNSIAIAYPTLGSHGQVNVGSSPGATPDRRHQDTSFPAYSPQR
jgi:hypothetical protein